MFVKQKRAFTTKGTKQARHTWFSSWSSLPYNFLIPLEDNAFKNSANK